jgi:hypothetical protein
MSISLRSITLGKHLRIIWAFMHLAMGVAIHVVLVLLPLGFLTDTSLTNIA